MRAIRLGNTFEIYGDGTQVRDYVHSLDVSAGMRLALDSEVWSGPMVIGSGRSLSVHEVIDAVRQVTGAEIDVRHGPPRAGEMPAVIVDPSRARAAGWSPQFTFEEGLAGVWEEWSQIDLDAVSAGVGTVGAPR
jgi:UDP-glucose 4-epimerase